ncbi:hypothetical protein CBI38_34665 (plasmid) [Rhodococcus oxybenzonivorans]|jgi:phospholipid/cholesterol/gamma-HCH transport system substrate-binding protein|uniref:Mce family protein n=2 Tax=Rhodococcus TaxID=1827 RepID=A0A2S2C6Q0_9NOCA|nr:MCE family protein [Rhodococcus oxybenzonivorans]AWK76522.1 hypothetical protein CBI38_34665 [Rhodococcus oxybenzonivorans]
MTAGVLLGLSLFGIVSLCLVQFRGGFDRYDTFTLRADRSGLVMDPGAKVQMHGVQIGKVSRVDMTDGSATLQLEVEPKWADLIPSNASAEIKATTAFGSKYVAINVPTNPSADRLHPGSTITSTNVTTEVNTLFESLTSVMGHIDPAKLNATLTAVADGLSGRGAKLGETLTTSNQYLSALNPHLPQLQEDFRQSAIVANTYAGVVPDVMGVLDNASTTSDTITQQEKDVGGLLLAAIGFGTTATDVGNENVDGFVASNDHLVPTTELLAEYSPEYPCLLNASVLGGKVMNNAVAETGYSLTVDAALLLGDNVYEYPKNLPKVAAKGGPGGKPGCYPTITKDLYPTPYLVADTGASIADSTSIKPNHNPDLLQWLLGSTPGGAAR